jgi:hypothetical protein
LDTDKDRIRIRSSNKKRSEWRTRWKRGWVSMCVCVVVVVVRIAMLAAPIIAGALVELRTIVACRRSALGALSVSLCLSLSFALALALSLSLSPSFFLSFFLPQAPKIAWVDGGYVDAKTADVGAWCV